MPSNYFDRQLFLSILKNQSAVETLYNMFLQLGGTKTANTDLVSLITRVTTLETADYAASVAAVAADLDIAEADILALEASIAAINTDQTPSIDPSLLLSQIKRLEHRVNQLEDAQ